MKHILIADDDAAIRRMLKGTLSLEGYNVFTAENGRVALERVRLSMPDLLLLDLQMPVLDGWEVYRHLRRNGSTLPIIIITASEQEDRVREELPGSDVLPKPFDLDMLLARIEAKFAAHA